MYVDSSALLKRYVAIVEVRRNLARLLSGRDLADARKAFAEDLASFSIIELDEVTCESAASIAEAFGVRTLDALHLGAAQRIADAGVGFLTFDLRQAQAARALGLVVVTA
jgi:predicted nucleic acid-binding protein